MPDSEKTTKELYRTLADILADPGYRARPEVVAPRLAWAGRTTLFAGREKAGKSTLASYAAAAVSAGSRCFEIATRKRPVLWLAGEEHPNDTAGRAQSYGSDPEALCITHMLKPQELESAAADFHDGLIVVDTLAAYVDGIVADAQKSAAWTPIMRQLMRVAHTTNAALLILHHARKSDGSYRDSTAIGAGVDVIIEMRQHRSDQWSRELKPKGRFPVHRAVVRKVGHGFRLIQDDTSLEERLIDFLAEHPGASKRQARENVSGSAREIGQAIDELVGRRMVENRGGSRAFHLFLTETAQNHSEPPENQ